MNEDEKEEKTYYYTKKAADLGITEQNLRKLLEDDQVGIFRNVEWDIIKALLEASVVRTYNKGDIVFAYGDPTEDHPVRLVIEGLYTINHPIRGAEVAISVDTPGILMFDVELVLMDVDAKHYDMRTKEKNQAFSTAICESSGKVLEIPIIVFKDQKSSNLWFNVSRLLGIKLMRRAFQAGENVIVKNRQRIVEYLRDRIKDKIRPNPNLDHKTEYPLVAADGFTETDVSKRLNIGKGVVNRFYFDRLKAEGLRWQGTTVEMTQAFYDKLITNVEAMAERKKVGRPPKQVKGANLKT